MKKHAKKYKEQGQVLIFAIVILIILLIATLFLFDLHSIIRAKMKLETAEQSAALTAAKWQARSLNLIGDINLIKAANGLLDDYGIDTLGDNDDEKIASANKTLTEMQSRISFCGPLIAFGAAQQAAKNNGVNINIGDSQSAFKSVYNDLDIYLEKLSPASNHPRYDVEAPNYYKWRGPYIDMLTHISDQGLAVRPNGDFAGIENVDPAWLYTPNDDSLYIAIKYEMWCHSGTRGDGLRQILKYPDSFWDGKWYDIDFRQTSFSGESEIYTLGIDFPYLDSSNQSAVEDALNNTNIEWTIRPQIQWCVYDSRWAYSSRNYTGPYEESWHRGMRLRDDLKKNVLYGGAIAYAECYQNIKLLNKYKSTMRRPIANNEYDQMNKAKESLQNNIVAEEEDKKPIQVGSDSASGGTPGGAVAKPLGTLPDGSPPTDAIIVLPLFVRPENKNIPNAALIPSSMQIFYPLRVNFSDVEKFIIWLSTVDDLHNPGSIPSGMQQYLAALQKLDDPTFRKTGWNNDYTHTNADPITYFSNDYKYNSVSNPGGAGWLQQIWLGYDDSRDDDASTELEEQDAGWNTRIYSGKYYILKDRNGNLVTNEQMVCVSYPSPIPNGSTNDGVPTT